MEQLRLEAFLLIGFTVYRARAEVKPEDEEGPDEPAEPEWA